MSDNALHTHIFVAYASEDQEAHDTLCAHLNVLKKEIPITIWSAANLMPGTRIEEDTQAELQRADIVLLLVSTDSLNSEAYANIQSQVQSSATFVPVLLRPCMWESDPFLKNLQPLPKNRQFISTSENQDAIYKDIAEEVKKMAFGESENTPTSSASHINKSCLWLVNALVVILLTGTLFIFKKSSPNVTDTTTKSIFETTDTTFKILILRFEDYISKKETECIGLSIKKLLKNLRDNKGMPLNPVYENSILSPEDLDSVKYLQKYHNADLLLYGLANQIKPECTGANVCFRRLVADTIMMNIDVPDDVIKVMHESDYELTSPIAIEQGKLSVDNQSMEAWIRALIALKEGNTEIYLFEIENMVGDLLSLTDKEKAIKYFNQGKVYYSSKEYEKANLSFDKAINLSPSHVSSYSYRSRCLHNLHRYNEAVQDYNTLIKLDSSNTYNYYVQKGDNLRHLEEIDQALSSLKRAIRIKPNNHGAYYIRGLTYYLSEDYGNSIIDFSKVLSIMPKHSSAYLSRGASFIAEKEYEKAILDFDKAIELKPNYVEAYNNRGVVYDKLEEYEKAILNYEKAIELKPDYIGAHNGKGFIYIYLTEYQKAVENFNKAIQIEPHAYYYNNRGYVYLKQNKFREAKIDLIDSQELDPENSWVYRNWSIYHTTENDLPKAIQNLKKSIELGYDDKEFLQEEELLAPLRSHPEWQEILDNMDDKNLEE